MKTRIKPIVIILLWFGYGLSYIQAEPLELKISADKMVSLELCTFNPYSGCITSTEDRSSLVLGDSIDFGDGSVFNSMEIEISLGYGEIYGQHTGELDLFIDDKTDPFASARISLPVIWNKFYPISKRFKKIYGKHKVRVVWDWYTANLKSITFSNDTVKYDIPENEIRIACLGNSITEGTEAGDRINNGYVGLLDQMLGNGYQVRNYGSSGATVCRNTYNSFSTGNFFGSTCTFQPDIVTICLGTNDSQKSIWNTGSFAANFETDYIYLIDKLTALESHPRIFLCLPPPIFPNSNWSHQPGVLINEIIPLINKIAREKGLEVIDFYTPLLEHNEYYAPGDQLHPLAPGHELMAKIVYNKLTGR